MNEDSPAKHPRKPRVDRERNRARLITAAKKAFSERGASTTLDHIAREAGVGIGTLYRHFPSRDALIKSVYQKETGTLVAAADVLMETQEASDALNMWLLQFVDFLETKRGMADVLDTLIGGPTALYSGSSDRLAHTIETLVINAIEPDALGVEPLDLLKAITGVANLTPGENWRQSAVQMIDVLLKGMQVSR